MTPLSVGAALAVVLGASVAVSVRNGRVLVLGLLVALAAAPMVPERLAAPLPYAATGLAAILASYLVWLAARHGAASAGSAAGAIAVALFGVAAFAAGWAAPIVTTLPGGAPAQGAGVALAALAAVPMLGRDPFRMLVAILLLVAAALLLRSAWLGPPTGIEALAAAALMTAAGVASTVVGRPEGRGEARTATPRRHSPAPLPETAE